MDRGGVARLTTVPFGRAATDALADVITTAKGGDLLAPVTVVVPGNLTGLALRRELGARPGGIVNVRFMVLDRLAELLGAGELAAQGLTPLDDAVRAALVRQVLAERPAPLARVASAHTTEAAVVEFLDELADADVDALEKLRQHSGRGRALAALADSLHTRCVAFYDAHDVALAAAEAVASGDADLRDVGSVVLHLPHRLGSAQLAIVEAFAAIDRLWAIVGLTGEPLADAAASSLVTALEPLLGSTGHTAAAPSPSTSVVSAPDALGEVRVAMRIVAAALESGTRLHRIGVVYRSRDPYAQLLDEELTAAGIPMHGPSVRTLAQTVTGRTLLGALALSDDGFSRAAVMRWMSSAPIRIEGGRLPSAKWARTARKAGIVRGVEQWDDRLGRIVKDEVEAAPLLEFVAWLAAECGVEERASWSEWSDWGRSFLRRALGSAAVRRHWRPSELDAFDAVERVVEGFRPLSDVEPGPIARAAVVSHLTSLLAAPAGRRGLFGEGVLCGSLQHAIGVDLDVLVVLGMAEGSFPPTGVSASLLAESERVAIGSRLRREARACDERRMFVAALASAPEQWLLYPRAGSERVAHPSPWLPAALLESKQVVPSFDAELDRPQGPASSLHEYDLRLLRACPGSALAAHPLVASETGLARGMGAIHARASDEFSEWEGNVGRHDPLAIDGTLLSATALETWAACPAHYLFKNVLGIREQDDVDDVDELEARHRGTLVHRILEGLGREHLGRQQSGDQLPLPLAPEFVSWTMTERDAIERVAEDVFAQFELRGLAPYPILWEVEKRRIVRDVVRTLATDEPDAILLAVEHHFGGDEHAPFTLTLPSGQVLSFKGSIDRVDRLHDRLRVIDYKTGQSEKKETIEAKIQAGTRVQLPLYGLAAQHHFDPEVPVEAGYWYVSAQGGWKSVSIPIADGIRQRFLETLDTISTEIAAGVFPANPGEEGYFNFDNCKWCEYDRICPADRDRAWLRLEGSPALKPYVALGESVSDESETDE